MREVQFTQFMFPGGRPNPVTILMTDDVADKADALKKKGFKFEIENKDQEIWMSASDHVKEKHIDRVCSNGPDVPKKVKEMIEEAYSNFIEGGFSE